ncbi:Peptidyl-prolyl cis-trans isomerase cyp6 [Terramyces sp. JEL0728]|nr:Peptidyl-prolyl cis-trans isomerase cyp6 [Terramyces sp. JEL0728]
MSVLIETSLGEIVVDLYVDECKQSSTNFIKLCKMKYYNFYLLHSVQKDFICQTGDPTSSGKGGESIWGLINGPERKYFMPEIKKSMKHKKKGLFSFATNFANNKPLAASQFFITLTDNHLDYLDGKHAIFGEVAEGLDVLDKINNALCDAENRPYRDIRIKHTIILDDPFDDPEGLAEPSRSPLPTEELLKSSRIGEDEELVPDLPPEELEKHKQLDEIKARTLTLEMLGDLPFAEIKPPENILFVCKLNSVTRDEDLEIIFGRFGKISSCEIVRDKVTGNSLGYAFIEFENKDDCEEAYAKMDNVLIDDRRIHVDFSQSVSKLPSGFMGMSNSKQEEHSYDLAFEGQDGNVKVETEINYKEQEKDRHNDSHGHSKSRDRDSHREHGSRGDYRKRDRYDDSRGSKYDHKDKLDPGKEERRDSRYDNQRDSRYDDRRYRDHRDDKYERKGERGSRGRYSADKSRNRSRSP